ncbi:alpha/beta hydrolase-fold protein [[Muricauda] lutisoli]|uniref:Tetratricopeptide repeat protein n=1 Tax=[Muricauda] lutisoli TaxID=2816035 RepID=A0ABS3F132_9FLAO|nr:alpha/beta hydrolase-fold protein [[Muricauda] lutisoli]MBO0331841.1 tetratricopeptide repeat protein [[Muricauda] lutisoli]
MKKVFILFTYILFQLSTYGQLANKIELTEDNRLIGLGQKHILKSEILKEDRPIIISLPVGYEDNNANYPVLYLLDGLGNIKHTIGTVEMLSETGLIPPMIIVGIESLDRARDLTPSNAGQNTYGGTGNSGIPQSGGAPAFLQFIETELIPYVESNYRTYSFRILEGHSFGGLFSVFTLMESPETFDAFIIEAPALWWNGEEMTEKAKVFFSENEILNKSVYFGIGGGDGWGMRQELLRYVEVIKQHTPENFNWLHEEVGDEDHDSSRLLLNYYGLKFVCSDLRMPEELSTKYSDESFLSGEEQLKEKYGKNVRRPAKEYVDLVMLQVEKENLPGAITILKRATEAYPNYIGLFTYLAQLYEQTNQISEAIATYTEGIEVSKKYKLGHEEDFNMEIKRLKK